MGERFNLDKQTIRVIDPAEIIEAVRVLCIRANTVLSPDVDAALAGALEREVSPVAASCLEACRENLALAAREGLAVCQDTGMAVVFIQMGHRVVVDGSLQDAVNEGVRRGYRDGYLRCSVTPDPLRRGNTGDNTPAVLYVEPVEGETLTITVAPKGFGSENMSRLYMLTPASGRKDVLEAVVDTVRRAGANPCPPVILGVGIGGTAEGCMLAAKKQLLRPLGSVNPDPWYAEMECEALEAVNALGLGPQGLGGNCTALGVHIAPLPTHIAGLPVAVNVGCHVTRHSSCIL
jgi:fumarate hydratase subunit alpha